MSTQSWFLLKIVIMATNCDRNQNGMSALILTLLKMSACKRKVPFCLEYFKAYLRISQQPAEVAEALNSQYISQFTREPTGDLLNIDGKLVPSVSDIVFTVPGIVKILSNLNPAKASGPDLIPARILKLASMEIAPILCIIFQQSYNTGQVPLYWQQASATVVFKKGDKTNPANYRPVSLTCIICKTMEHVIYSQIMNHLDSHHIIVESVPL